MTDSIRTPGAEPSLGDLFSELAHETSTLLRSEVELAKTELTAKAKTGAADAMRLVVGGAIVMLGAMALVAGVIALLGLAIPLWLSALIVGAVVAACGAALLVSGVRAFRRFDVVPRATAQTLKEDQQWVRQQLSQ